MTILCEPDQHAAAALVPALDGAVRFVANLPEAAMTVAADPTEDLVVIGPDAPLDQVIEFTGRLFANRPGVAVLLLRGTYDPAAIAAALAAGVFEVVPAGNAAALTEAYRRAKAAPARVFPPVALVEPELSSHEIQPAPQTKGQIVTVFSPKGGTGKTTISTNLAFALHGNGAHKVCILDLDLEFGDVAISLGLTPTRTLVDAVTSRVLGGDDELLRVLVTEYRPGLDCILAPIEPGDAVKIPAQLVTTLLDMLRGRYDYVVVDTPSQLSENVLAALDVSDHYVLLANPELPSLKNLRLTLDMLDLLGYPRQARSIVFNRADAAAGLSRTEVETALNSAITAEVPASRDVPASINRGLPIVAAKPDHPVSVAVTQFGKKAIVGESDKSKGHRRKGLLRRRSA